MTKTLPCRVCGKSVTIPAKYAGRTKSAVCLECAGKTPSEQQELKLERFKRSPAYIQGQILGVIAIIALPVLFFSCIANPQVQSLMDAGSRGLMQGIGAGSECQDRDPLYGGC